MIHSENYEVLTFDCYGTLIDWETGILGALRPILQNHGRSVSDLEILELYGEFEADAEAGSYQSYRKVLASVVREFGKRLGFVPTFDEEFALSAGLPEWRPWPDTVSALRRLQDRYQLAIISNIDNDLFERTRRQLEVSFVAIITAEKARCYKPDPKMFELALKEIGVAAGRILHVGQSVYHDVRPAQSLGMGTVWVNRPSLRKNLGAVRQAQGTPDLEVLDLKSLAESLLSGRDNQG